MIEFFPMVLAGRKGRRSTIADSFTSIVLGHAANSKPANKKNIDPYGAPTRAAKPIPSQRNSTPPQNSAILSGVEGGKTSVPFLNLDFSRTPALRTSPIMIAIAKTIISLIVRPLWVPGLKVFLHGSPVGRL